MQNLANIKQYKKGQALKGFTGLRGKDAEEVKDLGFYSEVSKAIEHEIDLLKKSLKDHRHTTSNSSLTLEQSIFSDMEFNQTNKGIEVGFYVSNEVGKYLQYGTKPTNKKPPYAMLDGLYTWGNSRGIFEKASTQKKQRSLAYGMAKAILKRGIIKRYGYKGSKWVSDVLGSDLEKLETRISDAIQKAMDISIQVKVTNDLKNMFKNGNNNNK